MSLLIASIAFNILPTVLYVMLVIVALIRCKPCLPWLIVLAAYHVVSNIIIQQQGIPSLTSLIVFTAIAPLCLLAISCFWLWRKRPSKRMQAIGLLSLGYLTSGIQVFTYISIIWATI